MRNPKISACIITYNQEAYIRDCLEGAINQVTNYGYEIVIGEDFSTDSTLQICKEYAQRYPNLIRLIPRNTNLGMAGNWMETIQSCKGDYVAICEGDDYWTDTNKLQKQVGFLEANPNYSLCFHRAKVITISGEIVDDYLTSIPENHETIEDLAEKGNYIHTPTVVFRNCIAVFPFEFQKSPILDHFLYIMLGEHGKIKYIDEAMANYRHGTGTFSSQSHIKIRINTVQFFSCLLSYLTDENLKRIILDRQLASITKLNQNGEYNYSSNKYLSGKKRFTDLFKIAILKILKK